MLKQIALQTTRIVFVAGCASSAYADHFYDRYQVSCNPEFGYFSFRTLTNNDFDQPRKNESDQLTNLVNKPYVCDLPKIWSYTKERQISVSVKDYTPEHTYGECSARARVTLAISVNGQEVRQFDAYGGNRCLDQETHLIEISPWNARDCALPELDSLRDNAQETKTVCEKIILK